MLLKKLLILGGDERSVALANSFFEAKEDVKVFGLSSCDALCTGISTDNDLVSAISDRDIIICGLPVTNDDMTVRTPFYDGKIYFYDLFRLMKKNQILLGGKISGKILNMGKIYSVTVIDYFKREELAVQNAVPTAEGAIEIAMHALPITLNRAKCLVLGYGRIGKVLSHMLYGIGADVMVEARKYSDLAWIKAYGLKGVHLSDLESVIGEADVIFNTVPSDILSISDLLLIKKNCPLIELASLGTGINADTALSAGVELINAQSLPGKVAPVTSGLIIKDTVTNIIKELGV